MQWANEELAAMVHDPVEVTSLVQAQVIDFQVRETAARQAQIERRVPVDVGRHALVRFWKAPQPIGWPMICQLFGGLMANAFRF